MNHRYMADAKHMELVRRIMTDTGLDFALGGAEQITVKYRPPGNQNPVQMLELMPSIKGEELMIDGIDNMRLSREVELIQASKDNITFSYDSLQIMCWYQRSDS